jgi:hypothetical protein
MALCCLPCPGISLENLETWVFLIELFLQVSCSELRYPTLKQMQTDIASIRRVLRDKTLERAEACENPTIKSAFELSLDQEGKGRDWELVMQLKQMTTRKQKFYTLILLPSSLLKNKTLEVEGTEQC